MKKIILSLFVLFLLAFQARASHIVGGEFELLYRSSFDYQLNLILYFDQRNGAPGARDDNALVSIFRKSDNVLMRQINLPLITEEQVNYTKPDCSIGDVQTTRLIYTNFLTLSANRFSDPGGYYVVWERCCRNYNIDNIFSEDPGPPDNPNLAARFAGQTFYLEFPPVTKNGEPFVNSTPRLFPPLSDYGCPFRTYYTDFAGTDIDGDSLVYSLVTPLNSSSMQALPDPTPAPHPSVQVFNTFYHKV